MPATYDVTTDAGQVRLWCGDTVTADALFQDDEIDAFLGMYGGDVLLAAALALDTMAATQAMILKVITQNGVATNGAAVAGALREQAAVLRRQAAELGDGDADDALWDSAETVGIWDPFAWRERIASQGMRGVG